MEKKALQLAISTLILIILGVIVLIALIYAFTGGFDRFSESTTPFIDASTAQAVTAACRDACNNEIKLTYCCNEYPIDDKTIKCTDSRLELGCSLECEPDFCSPEPPPVEE